MLNKPRLLLDGTTGPEATREKLKDGVILCELINIIIDRSDIKLSPIRKINRMKQPFKERENIGNFLKECENFDVEKHCLFQTDDLYDGTNMHSVILTLLSLGRKSQKYCFRGPAFGPRESEENRREFSDEQLQQGKHIIGLQMGTNKVASQSGMRFGKSRQILMD